MKEGQSTKHCVADEHMCKLNNMRMLPPPPSLPPSLPTFPRITERKQCLHLPPTCKSQTAISFTPAATNNNGLPAGEGESDGT